MFAGNDLLILHERPIQLKHNIYFGFVFCGFTISFHYGLIAGLAGRLLGPRRGALAAGCAG
jgi:hypothetical protein